MVLDALPIIDGCERKITGLHNFNVAGGYSAETSGGILTMMHPQNAREFIKESLTEYGQTTWIVGQVVKGTKQARLADNLNVMKVE